MLRLKSSTIKLRQAWAVTLADRLQADMQGKIQDLARAD